MKKKIASKDLIGKVKMELIPPYPLEMLGMLYTWGATKYAKHNWTKGLLWSETLAAIKRHTLKIEKGELIDKESGIPHSICIAWQGFAFYENMRTHPELNDLHKYSQGHIYNEKLYKPGYKKRRIK